MSHLEQTLTHLDINLGDACNLRCVHCPCWMNERAPRFDPGVLESRLRDAVEYVVATCPHFDKVMLIGGEPFVHEGVITFLKEQRIESACIAVYTNFVWPDADLSFPKNVHFLSSLDAPRQDVYGQLRRTRDFRLSQDIMRRNSEQLFHVDTTVSKNNLHHLDAILDITEPYGCSHWFLPIDPRVLRYATQLQGKPGAGTATETANAIRTARRAAKILLDDDDVQQVANFFERRASSRTNNFDMFMGVYLSGVDHFKNDTFGYRQELQITRPRLGEERCAGIRRYMEISFTHDGRYVPMVHCPELANILDTQKGPELFTFSEVMAWENTVRAQSDCRVFCGRTQFLALDEYEQTFRKVEVERACPA